jgi:hypothetical protein
MGVTALTEPRFPHFEQTSRLCQSGIAVLAPYRRAISAGSGSIRCRQSRHQTIIRTWAAAVPRGSLVVRGRVSLHGSANKLPTIATTSCPIAPRAAIPAAHAATGILASALATLLASRSASRRLWHDAPGGNRIPRHLQAYRADFSVFMG